MSETTRALQVSAIDKKFLSVTEASKLVPYSTDYITRLSREGKIEAVKAGRTWLVEANSLKYFHLANKAQSQRRSELVKDSLRSDNLLRRLLSNKKSIEDESSIRVIEPQTFLSALSTYSLVALMFILLVTVYQSDIRPADLKAGVYRQAEDLSSIFSFSIPDLSDLRNIFWLYRFEDEVKMVDESHQSRTSSASSQREFNNPVRSLPRVGPDRVIVFDSDKLESKFLTSKDKESATAYISSHFSDETQVTFYTNDSGVISPNFQKRKGDDYEFIVSTERVVAD